MKKKYFVFLAVLLGSLVLVGACGGSSASKSNANTTVASPSPTPVNIVSSPCNPVRIAKAFDQSGSMGWAGTKRVTAEELKPSFNLLLRCGGDLGITFIRGESNRPLLRFPASASVPPPPLEPKLAPKGEDEENYKFNDRKKEFSKLHAAWKAEMERRERDYLEQFEKFLQEVKPILETEPRGGTDFWGAVHRAKIFLLENKSAWSSPPQLHLILMTDGVDTVNKPKVVLTEEVTVSWVDSKTDDKMLQMLKAERYESFSAALNEIIAGEGGRENGKPK